MQEDPENVHAQLLSLFGRVSIPDLQTVREALQIEDYDFRDALNGDEVDTYSSLMADSIIAEKMIGATLKLVVDLDPLYQPHFSPLLTAYLTEYMRHHASGTVLNPFQLFLLYSPFICHSGD